MARQRRTGTLSRILKLIASAVFLALLAVLTFVSEVAVPTARYVIGWLQPTAAIAAPSRTESPPPDEAMMVQAKDHSKWIDGILEVVGALVAAMYVDAEFVKNAVRLESVRVQHLHFLKEHKFVGDLTDFQNKIGAFRKRPGRNERMALKEAGEMLTLRLGKFRAALWTDLHRKPRPGPPKS